MTRSELATAKKLFKQAKWVAYFKHLYTFAMKNERLYQHPKAAHIPKEHWKTIAWNSACLATWLLQEQLPELP